MSSASLLLASSRQNRSHPLQLFRCIPGAPTPEEWKPVQPPIHACAPACHHAVLVKSTWDRLPSRTKTSGLPRKEVIQPHLPVRLPCYDFTPITDPTLDACLPCGLAQRLQGLPTFVV